MRGWVIHNGRIWLSFGEVDDAIAQAVEQADAEWRERNAKLVAYCNERDETMREYEAAIAELQAAKAKLEEQLRAAQLSRVRRKKVEAGKWPEKPEVK